LSLPNPLMFPAGKIHIYDPLDWQCPVPLRSFPLDVFQSVPRYSRVGLYRRQDSDVPSIVPATFPGVYPFLPFLLQLGTVTRAAFFAYHPGTLWFFPLLLKPLNPLLEDFISCWFLSCFPPQSGLVPNPPSSSALVSFVKPTHSFRFFPFFGLHHPWILVKEHFIGVTRCALPPLDVLSPPFRSWFFDAQVIGAPYPGPFGIGSSFFRPPCSGSELIHLTPPFFRPLPFLLVPTPSFNLSRCLPTSRICGLFEVANWPPSCPFFSTNGHRSIRLILQKPAPSHDFSRAPTARLSMHARKCVNFPPPSALPPPPPAPYGHLLRPVITEPVSPSPSFFHVCIQYDSGCPRPLPIFHSSVRFFRF